MKLRFALLILIAVFAFSGCEKEKPVHVVLPAQPESSVKKVPQFPDTPYIPEPVVLDYDKSYFDKNKNVDKNVLIDEFVKEGKWEKNRYLWAKSCGSECIPLIEKRLDKIPLDSGIAVNENSSKTLVEFYNLIFILGAIGDEAAIPIFEKELQKSALVEKDKLNFPKAHSTLGGLANLAGQGEEKAMNLLYELTYEKNWLSRFPMASDKSSIGVYLRETLPSQAIRLLGQTGIEKGFDLLLDIMKNPEGHIVNRNHRGSFGVKRTIDSVSEGLVAYGFSKSSDREIYLGGRKELWDANVLLDSYLSDDFPKSQRLYSVYENLFPLIRDIGFRDILWARLKDSSRENEWALILELLGWQWEKVDHSRLMAFVNERLSVALNDAKIEAYLKLPVTLGFLSMDSISPHHKRPSLNAYESLLAVCDQDIWQRIQKPEHGDDFKYEALSTRWKIQCAMGMAVTGKKEAKKRLLRMQRDAKGDSDLLQGLDKALKVHEVVLKGYDPPYIYAEYHKHDLIQSGYMQQYFGDSDKGGGQ